MKKKRITNSEQLEGAEILYNKVKNIIHHSKNIDDIKFELILLGASLNSTKEYLIKKEINETLYQKQWWENCPMHPCEDCTNCNCTHYYEL